MNVHSTSNRFFRVLLPALLVFSFMRVPGTAFGGTLTFVRSEAVDAPYNLTALGVSDWATWGRGAVVGNYDHKATGGSNISDLTLVGSGHNAFSGPLANRGRIWSDGDPTLGSTGETGTTFTEEIGGGFSFTTPASTNTRTLYVYCGGYANQSQLEAHLSDSSATNISDIAPFVNAQFQNIYEITYAADSPGQTLTITYTKVAPFASIDIMAAWLVDGNPQLSVSLTNPLEGATFTAPTNITISANVSGGIGGITKVEFFYGANLIGTDTTSPYSVTWTNAPAGTHSLVAKLTDSTTATRRSTPVSITVNQPAGTGGLLLFTRTPAANAPYDLSALGTSDWVSWGRGGVLANVDRKAGSNQISGVNLIGTSHGAFSGNLATRGRTWSDGEPTPSSSGDAGTIFAENVGAGFSFTVLAGTNVRTLYVLCGGYANNSELRAQLSDASATNIVDVTPFVNDQFQNVYAITFKAGSAGQTLTITYTKQPGCCASIDLMAAWLVEGGVGGSMIFTRTTATSAPYNLTDLGMSDWVNWGRGGVLVNADRKTTGGNQISDVTLLGGGHGAFAGPVATRARTWTDGTPTASSPNDGGTIFTENIGGGFTFTAPADRTLRTLYVFCGGYCNLSQMMAELSDASATNIVEIAPLICEQFQNVYAITYRAGFPGQTLRITYTKQPGCCASIDLMAAWLVIGDGLPVLKLGGIQISGNNLELSFNSPNPAGTHTIQQTTNLSASPAVWTEVTGATFASGPGNSLIATFPKPAGSPAFYRVALQQP